MKHQHIKLNKLNKSNKFLLDIVVILFFTAIIATLYININKMDDTDHMHHEPYDSYTRQALAWKDGLLHLPEDVPWLELAIYEDKFYVSFPPVPSLVMAALIPKYGIETPNSLVCWIYAYIAYLFTYAIFRIRCNLDPWRSGFFAFAFVYGCNVFAMSLRGWVWFQAQTMAFMLATISIYFIMGKKRSSHILAYTFWALSVGCRPFNALYIVYLIYMTYKYINPEKRPFDKAIAKEFAIIFISPAIIALSMMWYNYIRFDNILEFGHNYLPAFTRSEYGQFSLSYVSENFLNIFRMPWFEDGYLQFHMLDGNNFLLLNPIFIIAILAMMKYRKRPEAWMVLVLIIINMFLFLTHLSLGRVQFGIRFFIDIIPWTLALILLDTKIKDSGYIYALSTLAICINIYGAWWFWIYNAEFWG